MKILDCDGLMITWLVSLAFIVLSSGFVQNSFAQSEANSTLDNSVKSSNYVTNIFNS